MSMQFQAQVKQTSASTSGFTPLQRGFLQRECTFGNHTVAGGEYAEYSTKKRSGLQTKLMINEPGDIFEREADRIADQVMATPEPGVTGAPPCIQRFPGQANGQMDTAPASVDHVLASTGKPLEPALRQDMERRFGHDFSRVQVHSGADAEHSAREVNANAYTVGHDMVFGAGRFMPGTHEGQSLIAHELTHVVQQSGGTAMIQRAPATDIRWSQDEKAARYRGQLIAKRIRIHTKLSKEVRAKINSELAYFEGAAKEAYLKEVRPALLAVTEIEMPEERVVPHGPLPIELSSLPNDPRFCGGSKCMTDEEINMPLIEAEKRDEKEVARLKEVQINELREQTKDWRADQGFAIDLLEGILRYTNSPDPRAVSDKIRQPILDRLRKWLKDADKARLEACAANDPGLLVKIRGRFNNDDPCKSWFEYEDSRSHGPSELQKLETRLNLDREYSDTAVNKVYWEVLEYRKQTDPDWLEQEHLASEMVGGLVAVAGAVGDNPGSTVSPVVTAEEGKVVSAKSSELPDQPKIVVPLEPPVGQQIPQKGVASPEPRFTPPSKPTGKVTAQPGRISKATTQLEMEEAADQQKAKVTGPGGESKGKTKGKGDDMTKRPKTSGGVKGLKSKSSVVEEDLTRIRQLAEWEKKNKITGDVQGLQARLRSSDLDTLSEARAEFDQAQEKIVKGEKWHVEEYGEDPREKLPEDTRISTANKLELEDSAWLKKRLPAKNDQREFMDWLKKGHREGDLGKEIEPGQKETEGHEHLSPGSPEAEEKVREWEREKGRRK